MSASQKARAAMRCMMRHGLWSNRSSRFAAWCAFAGMQLGDDARAASSAASTKRLDALALSSFEEYVRYLRQHTRGVSELELAVSSSRPMRRTSFASCAAPRVRE